LSSEHVRLTALIVTLSAPRAFPRWVHYLKYRVYAVSYRIVNCDEAYLKA